MTRGGAEHSWRAVSSGFRNLEGIDDEFQNIDLGQTHLDIILYFKNKLSSLFLPR
jgi:hypothetical protein